MAIITRHRVTADLNVSRQHTLLFERLLQLDRPIVPEPPRLGSSIGAVVFPYAVQRRLLPRTPFLLEVLRPYVHCYAPDYVNSRRALTVRGTFECESRARYEQDQKSCGIFVELRLRKKT